MTDTSTAKLVSIHELRPATWNPRAIDRTSFQRLVRSLERDPGLLWGRPVLAMRDGTIYAGNMRYEAVVQLGTDWRMRHFGADGVPAMLEDLTLEIAKERALRDNSQWGGWVERDLAEMLTELASRGVDIEIVGFSHDEIERLLALVSAGTPGDDDEFDPTPPTVPETGQGDLLLLGPHRLVCGDSRDPATWSLLMDSHEGTQAWADAMWTDPPYGVDLAGVALPSRGDAEDLALEGDLPQQLAPLLAAVFPNADRSLKPGAPFYVA